MPSPTSRRRSPPKEPPHARRFDVVAIGCSAGGLRALFKVLGPLAADFPASILIVQHLDPHHKSLISDLLSHKTGMRVKQAEHGEVLLPGVAYVAPPDEHLLAGPGKVQLAHSQMVHYSRPSIDLLFESVAGTYGSRSIAVILSGSNSDGSAGIRAIKEAGGTILAQDPAGAEFSTMPRSAVRTGCVDQVLALEQIGHTLILLCYGTGRA